MATITINGITVDPLASPRATATRAMLAAMSPNDASNFDYILVQTTHPLNQEEKRVLAETGASILEYVPQIPIYVIFLPKILARYVPFRLSRGPALMTRASKCNPR